MLNCTHPTILSMWYRKHLKYSVRYLFCFSCSKLLFRTSSWSVIMLYVSFKLHNTTSRARVCFNSTSIIQWNSNAESDENFGHRFSKNRTEPTSKFKKPKTRFLRFGFQKPTSAVWGRFFTLSHSQFILQHDRINSQRIFFMPCLCTSSSESLWLTISWTNSGRKYVISNVMHNCTLNNTQSKKPNQKPKPQLI